MLAPLRSGRALLGARAERVRPVELARGARRSAGAHRDVARVLDVRAMAGRVEPAVDDGRRRRVARGDVLAPAACDPAGGHPLAGAARDGRRGIVVGHVAVLRHVPRLPDRRGLERRPDGELPKPEAGAVRVDEVDRLRGEVSAQSSPSPSRVSSRPLRRPRRQSRSSSRRCPRRRRRRAQGRRVNGSGHPSGG